MDLSEVVSALSLHARPSLRVAAEMSRVLNKGGKLLFAGEIGFPPSANTHWRVAGNRVYLTQRGKLYRESVLKRVLEQSGGRLPQPTLGPVAVSLAFIPDSERAWDVDNRIKPVLDALEGILFVDDVQVVFVAALKLSKNNVACCRVFVRETEE